MKKNFTKEQKKENYKNELKKSHTRRHIERIKTSLFMLDKKRSDFK